MNINSADESNQQYIFDDELNIFIRGGSPISNINQQNYYDSNPLYYEEISCDSDENFDKYSLYDRKKSRKNKKSKNGNEKYKNKHRIRGQRFRTNGGNDNNNDQSIYKRKKLCKFFLQNKCYRPSQCVFMHGEFPCKYYYLGLKCPDDKICKLDHGKPLNDDMKEALLRHIQYAPDECLGNFRKIPSEVADKLFADRALEFKLIEMQLNKTKLEESSTIDEYDLKKVSNINFKENLKKNLNENEKNLNENDDNNNICKIKNINPDNFDDIFIHMNKELLNSDSYRMFVDDLSNKCNVEPLSQLLPISNNIEKLSTNFNDIDDRIKENLKKSIDSENYDDPNLKFFMIQFFLSLSRNKNNLNSNDIPQSLNINNFKEYLTEIQIEKLKELGINYVHHLSSLSLSNLNSLGISIKQISQIQEKSLNVDSTKGSTIISEEELDMIKNQTENCTKVTSTSADTDMRILPPVYSPDKWSRRVDTDCRLLSPSLDENVNDLIIDEEPELIIDEPDYTSDISDDDLYPLNLLQADLKKEKQLKHQLNENLMEIVNPSDNVENEEKTNELKQEYINYEPIKTKSELETNDYDNTPQLPVSPTELSLINLIEQNMNKSIHYGDMDMRFPFLPMVNFLPATEINASINLHDEIVYKVIEILIPEKKALPSSILVKLEPHHPDPRLRKEYFTQIDPRKRFDNHSEITSDPVLIIANNLNQLSESNKKEKQPSSIQYLHYYLQKSHWYNDQNSKRKIEINELIAVLGKAIKNYHQINNSNKQFNILNLYCAQKLSEILMNLGIDIDCNGYIIEINRLTEKTNQQEQNNNEQNNFNNGGIDFIYNNNNNTNINNNMCNNNQVYPMKFFKPPPLIPPLVSIQPLTAIPKPGLLGFAPGMPCDNTNLNISSSFWCPQSQNYYPNNSHDQSYLLKSHNSNYQQQKIFTNYFQRNHRKMNDRI